MSRRRLGAPCDLEEIRPDSFLVHNPAIGPLLSGEGERNGDRFRLTTWRREGLIGRLRARSFVVHTLADQIAALPDLPAAGPRGALLTRPSVQGERISVFGADPPGWVPAPETPAGVQLREGEVIRRRRGRGPANYYRVGPGGALQPLSEDAAVQLGYAQIAAQAPTIALQPHEAGAFLADLPLPRTHRLLLGRIAEATRSGWTIAPASIPLVESLLARLRLRVGKR
jgi:hypothetical protein